MYISEWIVALFIIIILCSIGLTLYFFYLRNLDDQFKKNGYSGYAAKRPSRKDYTPVNTSVKKERLTFFQRQGKWNVYFDVNTGNIIYENVDTGKKQTNRPSDLLITI